MEESSCTVFNFENEDSMNHPNNKREMSLYADSYVMVSETRVLPNTRPIKNMHKRKSTKRLYSPNRLSERIL